MKKLLWPAFMGFWILCGSVVVIALTQVGNRLLTAIILILIIISAFLGGAHYGYDTHKEITDGKY